MIYSPKLTRRVNRGKSRNISSGAKLQLRLEQDVPVLGYNKGDRKSRSDLDARTGDFEIANATIEVAVGLPDDKHLAQVAQALEDTDLEVWLLTRHDRVATWRNELSDYEGVDIKRRGRQRRSGVCRPEYFGDGRILSQGESGATRRTLRPLQRGAGLPMSARRASELFCGSRRLRQSSGRK